MAKAQTPEPVKRPKLATWMFDRDINLEAAGDLFGCSGEQVRRICLSFTDDSRQVPGRELMGRIVRATNGEITPGDFYPPVPDLLAMGAGQLVRV